MSDSHVAAGHKAALKNPNVSDAAKKHSKEVLETQFNEGGGSKGGDTKGGDTEGKNQGNVIGGLKAAIKNPNVSEVAKENAQERLDNM
ncbi:Conidiation-specific protein 6 [Cladobotryum mycophilum]|uniref:Conidiation-specific protein 6 n=1 Tax=Cladobotryum mycophilum TaxID=491253 RepID=A0ABR0SCE0_9HYPO